VRLGLTTATAFVADYARTAVFEACVRPACSSTPILATIARWHQSATSMDRIAANFLRRAAVGQADAAIVREAALARCESEPWAVAALACHPGHDTLDAACRVARRGRMGPLPTWSARTIEAALTPPSHIDAVAPTAPRAVTLVITTEAVQAVAARLVRAEKRIAARHRSTLRPQHGPADAPVAAA
jgi:hypothetical protein